MDKPPQTLTFVVERLVAEYSNSFHFKVKIGIKGTSSECETKGTYRYEKGTNETIIKETLILNLQSVLTKEMKLQACLQVYTKSGFKTAGAGEIPYQSLLNPSCKLDIEIMKCPLGKGSFDIMYSNNDTQKDDNGNNNINIEKENELNELKELNMKNKKIIDMLQKEKDNLLDKIQELNQINESDKKTIEKLKSSSNNNAMNSYSSSKASSNTSLREKEKIISELKSKIEYFESENNEMKSIISDIKNEKKQLADEKNAIISSQKNQLNDLNEEISQLNFKIENLEQSAQVKLNEQSHMSSKALSDYEKKTKTEISELNHKITKLTSTNELLENELNSKASKFTELQLQFEKYKKSHVSNQSDIQTQLDLKQTELLQLQRTLLDKSSEIKKLKDELDEANENLNTIREQFEQLRNNKSSNDSNTLNILNEQIKTKDASILSLKTEIQELKDKLDSQMQLNPTDNTNTNVSSAKSSEKKLKENLINLRSLVNNQKDEIQKLNEVNISLRKENEKMKSQIKNTETNKAQNELFLNQFQEMQQIYRDKENKFIQEKNDEIFKLQKENENLKNQLKRNANGNGDNAKFLSEISKLNEQKDSLEEDLKYYKELNMKFVDTQKKSTSLENENVKLKMLLDEKRLENEKIEREKISLIQEKDKLEKELLSSKEKMGELLNELSEAEKKSIDLNCELVKQLKKYGKDK